LPKFPPDHQISRLTCNAMMILKNGVFNTKRHGVYRTWRGNLGNGRRVGIGLREQREISVNVAFSCWELLVLYCFPTKVLKEYICLKGTADVGFDVDERYFGHFFCLYA